MPGTALRCLAPDGPNGPLPPSGIAATLEGVLLRTLLLLGGLLPLLAMLVALFAAAWIREGRRHAAPAQRKD
ncbi:MAG: hypothetical protein QOF27_2411 [Gaiellaceae bacterium]|nr:hypothetical protein [Gaiellaceae bacterium]MDX6440728.1 hypothetical protein [Gaiellaceae bacterium]